MNDEPEITVVTDRFGPAVHPRHEPDVADWRQRAIDNAYNPNDVLGRIAADTEARRVKAMLTTEAELGRLLHSANNALAAGNFRLVARLANKIASVVESARANEII